eukprot:scaffold157519_cov32-Prasinocladus_malaysianus.AAC.2
MGTAIIVQSAGKKATKSPSQTSRLVLQFLARKLIWPAIRQMNTKNRLFHPRLLLCDDVSHTHTNPGIMARHIALNRLQSAVRYIDVDSLNIHPVTG